MNEDNLAKITFLLAMCAVAATASAQQSAQPSDGLTLDPTLRASNIPEAPDTIKAHLAEAGARPAGLWPYSLVSLIDPAWHGLNRRAEEYGLKFGLSYTAVYQNASSVLSGDRDAAGGDVDLFAEWRLLGGKDDPNRGLLYFALENRHDLGLGIAPAELGDEFGSAWGTTDGFNVQDTCIRELYWQQHLGGDRLIITVGKIDPKDFYNSNYWESDNSYFMNEAFSGFPVIAYPGKGLGVNLTMKLSDQWYVSAGAQDAQGVKTTSGFDTFFDDFDLFSAGELGFTPTIEGLGEGTYRFTGWYRAAGESNGKPHDSGFAISIDQHISENLIPFFRYGVSDGNVNGIEQMVSAGIGWQGKLLTKSDVIGVAGSWGRPSDHELDDESVIETFYRFQVSPDIQLTAGYQAIFNPVDNPDDDVVGVFETRMRITF